MASLTKHKRIKKMNDEQILQLELVKKAKTGDKKAIEELVLRNRDFVRKYALRYSRDSDTLNDMIQEGILGLVESVKLFDESFGTGFLTYATVRIRKKMLDYRAKDTLIPAPRDAAPAIMGRGFRKIKAETLKKMENAFLGTLSLEALVEAEVPEKELGYKCDETEKNFLISDLESAISLIKSEKVRESARHAFVTYLGSYTLKDLAREENISPQALSQRLKRAKTFLRQDKKLRSWL